MEKANKKKDYFGASHLAILFCYTVFSVALIGEALLLGWEKWALIPVTLGVVSAWFIHIRQAFTAKMRVWIYSILMMILSFFYGVHLTSTFDLGFVMALLILILVSTGIAGVITLAQITYYVVLAYDVIQMMNEGYEFDGLMITRTLLHLVVITFFCYFARGIIKKWNSIMEASEAENAALAENTEKLNDFLANISHELRTPINAVIGLTGICIEKEDDEEIKRNLLLVSEAGKRVGDHIDDILDHSEIDMHSLVVNNEEYMLSSMLNDIVTEISPHRAANTELVIDVDPKIPAVMSSDIGKLKKILKHLIDNGLKYTKEGGVYVHITSEERDYGINLLIEVKDTGIGMSNIEMEKVLDSFYQADSGRSRSTSGLGLGLSIVNGFTTKLNGFLTLESEEGTGTTVRVSIPQKIVDPEGCMSLRKPERLVVGAYLHFEKYDNPDVRSFYNLMIKDMVLGLNVMLQRADNLEAFKKLVKAVHFTHIIVGKEEYEEDPQFMNEIAKDSLVAVVADDSFVIPENANIKLIRKPFYCFPVISFLNADPGDYGKDEGKLYARGVRALVVDDEPMNHMVAREILDNYGMEVFTASSGEAAIDFIHEHDTDIIFMDHMMPGMDGVEAMKRIRAIYGKQKKDVPIVALTANAVSTAREMFIKEGFDAFLAKPIEISELERIMKKVLPKSALTVEMPEIKEKAAEVISTVEEKADGEDFFGQLRKLNVDPETGLHYCQNDRDFYKQLLEQYAKDAPQKISDAKESFKKGDLRNYEIIVHSVKSTSKMIGCMSLYNKMFELEKAAKSGLEDKIRKEDGAAMDEYKRLADGLAECLGITLSEQKKEGSDEGELIMEFGPEGGDAS